MGDGKEPELPAERTGKGRTLRVVEVAGCRYLLAGLDFTRIIHADHKGSTRLQMPGKTDQYLVPDDDGEPLVLGEESVVGAPVKKLPCSGTDSAANGPPAECGKHTQGKLQTAGVGSALGERLGAVRPNPHESLKQRECLEAGIGNTTQGWFFHHILLYGSSRTAVKANPTYIPKSAKVQTPPSQGGAYFGPP